MITAAKEIRFRCSSLSYIMAGARSKAQTDAWESGDLSAIPEGVKTHLLDVYASQVHFRRDELVNKFLKKGHAREQDAIDLVSMHGSAGRKMFYKNSLRLDNEWISGEPDFADTKNVKEAKVLYDTKCSYSLRTFLKSSFTDLDDNYEWQGHGYMWLTGAEEHHVCFCLVNGTAQQIAREKYFVQFNYDEDDYLEQYQQIERNHIFDRAAFQKENPCFVWHTPPDEWFFDIPAEKRLHEKVVKRDQQAIDKIQKRVELSWAWMDQNLFNKSLQI